MSSLWIKIISEQLTLLIIAWLHMAVADRLFSIIFLCFPFTTKGAWLFFLFYSFILSQWWDPSQFWESRPPWCVPPSPPRPGACDPTWGAIVHENDLMIWWLWYSLFSARSLWPPLRSHGLDFWWQWGWVGGNAVTLVSHRCVPPSKCSWLRNGNDVVAWGRWCQIWCQKIYDVKTYQLEQQQLRKSELETANNDQHDFLKSSFLWSAAPM